jgi:hypothetical protein
MADLKISQFTVDGSPSLTDRVPTIKDPTGTPLNRVITLQTLLDLIETNGAANASFISAGTFANARIAASNVTQHQAALSITKSQIPDFGTYLSNTVEDTTPQLGGALDVNGQKIVSVSNGNIDIEPNGTGNVLIGNLTFDADQTVGSAQSNFLLGYNHGTGLIVLRPQTQAIALAISDEITNLTTGTNKLTFRMPYAFVLTGVRASATTAPTGSSIIVDINSNTTSIFSTRLSIDATSKTSVGSASPAVLTTTSLANDAEITIDIDQIGSTVAGAGLKVYLLGYPT